MHRPFDFPLHEPNLAHVNGSRRLSHGMVTLTSTPVRTGLDSATWLQTVISPLPAKPSPELEKFLQLAFDMSKVIESFIKHEDSLPRELKRHLNSLEKLLESMVWEKGSSLYNPLIVAKPSLSDEIKRLNLLADPMPSLDEIAMSNQVLQEACFINRS
ncbi:hypothetical protein Pint_02488 [Pistacia integerrima]|uniref:Uncharacterized protein n=1 Tax=Pistacia integerrima TaxID=434235 RepID=A0ACC0ZN12_9ROSI|nr:hypothetical protein Pint_02488 [Pistacia integerrima]